MNIAEVDEFMADLYGKNENEPEFNRNKIDDYENIIEPPKHQYDLLKIESFIKQIDQQVDIK